MTFILKKKKRRKKKKFRARGGGWQRDVGAAVAHGSTHSYILDR